MLYRFFAKEKFEELDAEMEQFFQLLGLSMADLKVKKQPATYHNAYQLIVEGTFRKRRFVLSLHRSPLKVSAATEQLEVLFPCENPAWIALEFLKKSNQAAIERHLDLDIIDSIPYLNEEDYLIASNNEATLKEIFDRVFSSRLEALALSDFVSFSLERQRLYYKVTSFPITTLRRNNLVDIFNFSIDLLQKIDQLP